jgi:hypothetical protein
MRIDLRRGDVRVTEHLLEGCAAHAEKAVLRYYLVAPEKRRSRCAPGILRIFEVS